MARFLNHYTCPGCGEEWSDAWDCMVDDDCGACGLRHISPTDSDDLDNDDPEEPAAETVALHDGPELQHLVPGVAAVPLTARQIAQEAQRRAGRRGDAPLPSGGLFDDVARAQQDLFA